MRVFAMLDGAKFLAEDEADLVSKMRIDAERWAPAADDAQYMKQTAARAKVQTGRTVRSDTPEHFVADLIAAGLVTELTVH
jgi:hypothetical protein